MYGSEYAKGAVGAKLKEQFMEEYDQHSLMQNGLQHMDIGIIMAYMTTKAHEIDVFTFFILYI